MLWCLGMYASGSTWVFNAAMQVAALVGPHTPAVGCFVTGRHELDFLNDPASLAIVKSHDTDEAAATELARRANALLVSIRDPRDCVTSLMLYQRYNFAAALAATECIARFCVRLAGRPDANSLALRGRVHRRYRDARPNCREPWRQAPHGRSRTHLRRDAQTCHRGHSLRGWNCYPRHCATKPPAISWAWRRSGTRTTPNVPGRWAAGAPC